jgi:hypothetical protein
VSTDGIEGIIVNVAASGEGTMPCERWQGSREHEVRMVAQTQAAAARGRRRCEHHEKFRSADGSLRRVKRRFSIGPFDRARDCLEKGTSSCQIDKTVPSPARI